MRNKQHSWNGCKCDKCGKKRNEQHDWIKAEQKCTRCGLNISIFLNNAIENDNIISVKEAIKAGADLNFKNKDTGQTALRVAAVNQNLNMCNLLIENGAKVDARFGYGLTVLHESIINGSFNIALLLIEKGADINSINDNLDGTVLFSAASLGKLESCRFILQNGGNIFYRNRYGQTVLHNVHIHYDKKNDEMKLIELNELLLKYGADINANSTLSGLPLDMVPKELKKLRAFLIAMGAKSRYNQYSM